MPWSRLRSNLTWRGLIVLFFGLYLLLGPVKQSHDVVAAMIGVGLLVLLGVVLGATLFTGFRRRQQTLATLHGGFGNLDFGSWSILPSRNTPHLLTLELHEIGVPPGYHLVIAPMCTPSLVPEVRVVIPSNAQREVRIPFQISFPHRGVWHFHALDCALRDNFGLTAFHWRVGFDVTTEVTVVPPFQENSETPMYTSASREGDLMTSPYNRHGDPFDIKPYHPSDGMRKILWKLYAKRRELHARHPEFAASPEGLSAIIVWADIDEDAVCSEALSYTKKLFDAEIGVRGLAKLSNGPQIAASPDELLALCSRFSVTDAPSGYALEPEPSTPQEVVERLCAHNELQRAIIFCSSRCTHEDKGRLEKIGILLSARGVKPVFVVVSPSARQSEGGNDRAKAEGLLSMLFYPEERDSPSTLLQPALDFIQICYKHDWMIEVPAAELPVQDSSSSAPTLAYSAPQSYKMGVAAKPGGAPSSQAGDS